MSDKSIGMWVTIDRQRLLERFTSEELLVEVAGRKATSLPVDKQARRETLLETINEAIDCLKSGRTDDALLTLERGAYPKFKSFEQSTAQYLRRVRD